MKINILTSGRFHVLDLARELSKLGYDVKLYSYVPVGRAESFGLEKKHQFSLLFFMMPLLVLMKLFPKSLLIKKMVVTYQDFITALVMRKADVVIAMSGLYIKSLEIAKKNNAKIIVERGSKHILEQKKILEAVPSLKNKKPVPDFDVNRELMSYQLADYVVVPALHAVRSFLERDFPKEKIFKNPYGVDLEMFQSDTAAEKIYDVCMTGNWGYQKGCDLIAEACKDLNLKFLHVGAIGDLEFPKNKNFTHIDTVNQPELKKYYNSSKIFVLPSRQEGLAMVQLQALRCGLPIVFSEHTGGEDIELLWGNNTGFTYKMNDYSAASLKEEIIKALSFVKHKSNQQPNFENLSWKAYGERYAQFLNKL